MRLGRPKDSQNKEVKLTGKEDDVKKLLDKKVALATIAQNIGRESLNREKFYQNSKNWVGKQKYLFLKALRIVQT